MNLKGVNYNVGNETVDDWRPDYNPKTVKRELQIIKNDLHCNIVGISGRSITRLETAARAALDQGLMVWLMPYLWGKNPKATLNYTVKAAKMAQSLLEKWPGQLIFSAGAELTIFMRGVVKGNRLMTRLRNAFSMDPTLRNRSLNEYLYRVSSEVRKVFHGKISYNSLIWENVDWKSFDYIGIDHYWSEKIKGRYLDMLKPHLSYGKPVMITGFGFPTTNAPFVSASSWLKNINTLSQVLHQLPIMGRFIKAKLNKVNERDESCQARRLIDTIKMLDGAGVYGVLIDTFIFPLSPYSDNPKYDVDRESESLVKYYEGGRHGITYPDMTWEPKESFKAVADYYLNH